MTRLRQVASPGAARKPRRHRWGDKVQFPLAHKSERTCTKGCGVTEVKKRGNEGGRDIHWTEFWRDGEQIKSEHTPACEPVREGADHAV